MYLRLQHCPFVTHPRLLLSFLFLLLVPVCRCVPVSLGSLGAHTLPRRTSDATNTGANPPPTHGWSDNGVLHQDSYLSFLGPPLTPTPRHAFSGDDSINNLHDHNGQVQSFNQQDDTEADVNLTEVPTAPTAPIATGQLNVADETDAYSPDATIPPSRSSEQDENLRVQDLDSPNRGHHSKDHLVNTTILETHLNHSSHGQRPAKERCQLVRKTVMYHFEEGCSELDTAKPMRSFELQICSGSCYSEASLLAVPVQYSLDIVTDPETGLQRSILRERNTYRVKDFYVQRCKCCRQRESQLKTTIWAKCKKKPRIRSIQIHEAKSCGCKKCR